MTTHAVTPDGNGRDNQLPAHRSPAEQASRALADTRLLRMTAGAWPIPGLALPRAAPARAEVIRRLIDPRLPAAVGPNALTAADYKAFLQNNVQSEYRRVTADEVQHIVRPTRTAPALLALVVAFRTAQQAWANGPGNEAATQQALGTLVDAINDAANDIEAERTRNFASHKQVRGIQPADYTEDDRNREQRQIREGIMVEAGSAHAQKIRGFRSSTEAQTTMQGLRDNLRAAGLDDIQVAARGSAVRGTNRDNTRPYRPGTGMDDNANDSSDVDFFFFSTKLEKIVNAMTEAGLAGWRQGGNIHPDDLVKILRHKDCAKRLQRAGINGVALLAEIARFPTATKALIGRKSDVTLLRLAELANFAPNEYVLL